MMKYLLRRATMLAFDHPRRMRTNDPMISQKSTNSQFDLFALFDESVPMSLEIAKYANVFSVRVKHAEYTSRREACLAQPLRISL